MKDVDFFSPGARLALELECLLLDTRDTAVLSRWWDSAHEALEQWRQAVRDMEASIDAVQPEASTTLEQADDHAHICFKLAEQYKSDPVLFAALTDAAAIIRDLMRDRLGASASGAGQAEIEALRAEVDALRRYYKNGVEIFANPCEKHGGERTPPPTEFFEKYGGQCLICVVDNNKALQAENERLRNLLRRAHPIVCAHARASHLLEGLRPKRNQWDELADAIDAAKQQGEQR